MTLHTSPDAGWYADPNGGPGLRYWDGAGWTAATQQVPAAFGNPSADNGFAGYAPAGGAPGYPGPGAPYPGGGLPGAGLPGAGLPANRPRASFLARNRYFAITTAICVVYAVIASFSNFAFFGVLPALYTFRSFQAKEPLALVALLVTVATIFFSLRMIYG